MGDADGEGSCVQGHKADALKETSVPSAQLCCEPKTALKNKA